MDHRPFGSDRSDSSRPKSPQLEDSPHDPTQHAQFETHPARPQPKNAWASQSSSPYSSRVSSPGELHMVPRESHVPFHLQLETSLNAHNSAMHETSPSHAASQRLNAASYSNPLPVQLLLSPQNESSCNSPHSVASPAHPATNTTFGTSDSQTSVPQPPLLRIGSTNAGGEFDPRSRNQSVSFSDQYGSERSRRFTISSQPVSYTHLTLPTILRV